MKFICKNFGCLFVFLLLHLSPSPVNAQDTLQIRGTILSGSGDPLENISVSIEGESTAPSFTDSTGTFTIQSPSADEWLIISPPGEYKARRIRTNGRSSLTIYLTPEGMSSGNDPVMILGRPIIKKNMVSSFSELDMSGIKSTRDMSVDQYMQGRVTGMYVANMSSQPGSGAFTLLRGLRSINTNSEPFYLVDGMPTIPHGVFGSNIDGNFYNPLLSVNPFDISKTTVIKDPTVTAAYGSKASNGLVLIETLDPSAIQTAIELDMRTGYNLSPERYIPQLNATQHKTLVSELLISEGLLEETVREEYPDLYLEPGDRRFIDYQHDTNWQNYIFSNTAFSNFNLNVKGGDEIAKYGLSFGFTSGNGIIESTGYQGYNLRFVGALNIFKWLKMNTSVSMINSNSQLKESARIQETSPILTSLAKSPLLNPYRYDNNGNEINELSEVDELGVSNPLAIIENYEARNRNNEFNANFGINASISKDLNLTSNFGLTFDVLKEQLFMPNHGMEQYYDKEAYNVAKASTNSMDVFYNNTNLLYAKSLNENHHLSLSTGMNLMTDKFQFDYGLTKNAHINDEYRQLQDGTNNLREMGGQNRIWSWISFYENAIYSYRGKYLLNATVNLDGSSRVGDEALNTLNIGGSPMGLFYSGGAAWIVSEESFLQNTAWLDELKIRISAGKTGNDDIGESNAKNYYDRIRYRSTVGLFPAIITNDQLSYENVYQYNAGLDMAFLGYRFSVKFDAYKSETRNMLIYVPLEPYFGYSFRPENNGQMENTGLEISSFMRIIDGHSFKWDMNANVTTLKNQILDIKGGKQVSPIQGGELVNMPGEPANSFYGYVFKGVYSSAQEAGEASLLNNKGAYFRAGDAIYEDLSGPDGTPDGVINEYDKTIIGSPLPNLYGGLVNTFTYKRWSLSGFIQFVSGNDIFNYVRYMNERMTGLENQSASTLRRWQYDGQKTDIPRASWNDPMGNSAFSSRWIEDGSYLRLKNVTLSYTIPESFLAFQNAKFYVSANNLLTLSEYLGYDPEVAYSYSPFGQGVDYGLAPQTRYFMVGINLGL